MNKSRLLFVVDDLTVASGRNCQLRQLVESLPVSEYEVHIATSFDSRRPDCLQVRGASLHCLDHRSTTVSKYLELRKLSRQLTPDIVHAWGYSSHLPVAFSHYQDSTAKVIYSYFCMPPRRLMIRRWLEEHATREPAMVTVPHSSLANRLKEQGFDNSLHVVPNAVIEIVAERQRSRQRLMEMLGISEPVILAGTLGSMEPRFRHKDLIWATDLMYCVRDDVHLVIFGYGSGKAALEHFLGKTEATTNVHFVDARDIEVTDLAGLDAYWNAQLEEPNPAMMLTAMAYGVPVITVLGDELSDAILPMQSAFSTNFGARDEFARWTKFVIEQRKRSEQLAAQGQEHVKKKFSLQQMVDGFVKLYSST